MVEGDFYFVFLTFTGERQASWREDLRRLQHAQVAHVVVGHARRWNVKHGPFERGGVARTHILPQEVEFDEVHQHFGVGEVDLVAGLFEGKPQVQRAFVGLVVGKQHQESFGRNHKFLARWQLPLLKVGVGIGEEPAADVDGIGCGVVEFNPVVGVALFVHPGGEVGGHHLVDHLRSHKAGQCKQRAKQDSGKVFGHRA